MAISSMSSVPERSFGFERFIEYMSEAAKGSCIPAQAIIKRLYEAQGLSISAIADEQLLETWLYNSVSTGSFVAAEDLTELNPALLLKAQVAFRKAGGYNAEASHQTAHQSSSLDIDMARLTCEGGVESLQDLNGNKVLHFAAMFDKPEAIKYLVEERRAAVNSQNDRGETPLHKACLAGHHAAVEMLISLGADASIASTQYQVSPLHWLFNFEEQHIDKMAQLLVSKGKADVGAIVACEKVGATEEHPPFIHFPFHWPFGTPLHWAASTRCTTAIDSLLKLGADINARDSQIDRAAQTALAMAARRGDSKIVQYLLNKGASATAVSDQGHNAFHTMALTYMDCNRFYKFWEGFDAWIYNGIYENHLAKVRECVLALLRAGCDLDRRRPGRGGKLGRTPFLEASIAENCVVALALLEAGANVNCEDSSHQLPVHLWAGVDDKSLAYPQGFLAIFQKLVGRIEDINIKAGFLEETILHYVVRAIQTLKKSGFEERIRLLVTHDPPADINALDKQGATPLLLAISGRYPGEAVERSEILLQYGARVHYDTEADIDFLFILSFNPILTDAETTYLLKRLLEGYSNAEKLQMATSSVTRVWGTECTALSAAIKLGKFECVKYLLELGVDPNTINDERITSLDWALTSGEQIRRSYLETLADYFTRDERDAASERGVAFGLRFRDDDTGEFKANFPAYSWSLTN
jgi:ankyrin repeat protein